MRTSHPASIPRGQGNMHSTVGPPGSHSTVCIDHAQSEGQGLIPALPNTTSHNLQQSAASHGHILPPQCAPQGSECPLLTFCREAARGHGAVVA